jgi:hypothetical protein
VCDDVSRLTSPLSVESNVKRRILPVSRTFRRCRIRLNVAHRHPRWLLRFPNVASELGEAGESDASELNELAMSGQLETRRVFIKQVAGTNCVGAPAAVANAIFQRSRQTRARSADHARQIDMSAPIQSAYRKGREYAVPRKRPVLLRM